MLTGRTGTRTRNFRKESCRRWYWWYDSVSRNVGPSTGGWWFQGNWIGVYWCNYLMIILGDQSIDYTALPLYFTHLDSIFGRYGNTSVGTSPGRWFKADVFLLLQLWWYEMIEEQSIHSLHSTTTVVLYCNTSGFHFRWWRLWKYEINQRYGVGNVVSMVKQRW